LGNDRLDGGTGNDLLTGSLGNDTFVFGAGFGHDTIVDWSDNWLLGNDVISLQGMGLSMADLAISYSRSGATIEIIGTDDEIFLLGARQGTIGAEDFLF
jgi:Ca2+-binding RTX toxin-like protein